MIETLGFYFSEYHLVIKAWLPVFLSGLVFALILWLVIWATKKTCNKNWERNPEQRELASRVKIRCLEQEIDRLEGDKATWEAECHRLRALNRAGADNARKTANLLGVEL